LAEPNKRDDAPTIAGREDAAVWLTKRKEMSMSVTTVVDFQPSQEVDLSSIRRISGHVRIRRAIGIALMLLAVTAGIQGGMINLQRQFEAARHASVAPPAK
jgi:hypothetical protein